jgi:hypothetical protein
MIRYRYGRSIWDIDMVILDIDMGDDSIDMVILDIDMGCLVTLAVTERAAGRRARARARVGV